MRFAANISFIALATWAIQQLAITLRFPTANISAYWTGYAFALAALLTFPLRHWPAVLTAVFAALLIGYVGDPVVGVRGLMLSYPIVAATLMIGAWAIPRLGGAPLFGTLRSMLVFSAATLCMPVPIVAVLAPSVASDTNAASQTALALYLAFVVGTLAATPAFTALMGDVRSEVRIQRPARLLEAISLGVLLLGVTSVAMSQPATSSVAPALLYAPLPLLIWAAGRFGPAGASWGLIAVGYIASWSAVRGRGPIVAAAGAESVLSLELSLLAIALPVLILAALAREREHASAALEASGRNARTRFAQLSTIYRTTPVGLAFVDHELRYVSINDQLAEITGLTPADHIGRRVTDVAPPPSAELTPLLRRVIETGKPIVDREVHGAHAHDPEAERDWLASYHPVADEGGAIAGISIVMREVTERKRAETALRESEAALRGSYAAVDDLAARLISAQEAERTRIARELHDHVNQKLASISIALSQLRRHPQRSPQGLFAELARVQAAVNEVNRELRQLSHELHPGVLRHAGLVAALRSACDDLSRLHAAAITFVGKEAIGPLPDDVALCLYRVAQEALQNVVSHSGARHAQVSLTRDGDDLELTVTDDGRGFEPSDLRRRGGLGLISIHERVQLVDGSVHIEASPHHGTVLRVRVPVPELQLAGPGGRPDAPLSSFSVETRAGR